MRLSSSIGRPQQSFAAGGGAPGPRRPGVRSRRPSAATHAPPRVPRSCCHGSKSRPGTSAPPRTPAGHAASPRDPRRPSGRSSVGSAAPSEGADSSGKCAQTSTPALHGQARRGGSRRQSWRDSQCLFPGRADGCRSGRPPTRSPSAASPFTSGCPKRLRVGYWARTTPSAREASSSGRVDHRSSSDELAESRFSAHPRPRYYAAELNTTGSC